MDKIGNLAIISNNLYDYNNWMDKIKNFVGNNANLDNSQDGIKPYKTSSEDVKLDLKLNLNETEKEKVIKAFGYKKIAMAHMDMRKNLILSKAIYPY
ncbi:Uncharacterised protein [Campylobacter hyointestinalis subsp. hyointestinalis]|uniref:hypothetical protein n=1 Tax=Campylobacter hyointestinalis TaxID=198 RepID=UPI000723A43D|nr:hypothetical protein [Campylobacter hyointestinalis]CUU79321.1 Uncharacterised protein [Campylobacter hyointestinalis subsp. hyointestinalis]